MPKASLELEELGACLVEQRPKLWAQLLDCRQRLCAPKVSSKLREFGLEPHRGGGSLLDNLRLLRDAAAPTEAAQQAQAAQVAQAEPALLTRRGTWHGQRVPDYKSYLGFGKMLGHGAFAQVYSVRDAAGRSMALKLTRSAAKASALREHVLLRSLSHANVLRLYDFFFTGHGRLGLLTELVEGYTLKELAQAPLRAHLAPVLLQRLAADLFGAVAYLHREGVAHRDIKPANAMLDKCSRRCVLLDFGIACRVGACGLGYAGTLNYTAPERWRKCEAREMSSAAELYAADVWSSCMTLYVLLRSDASLSARGGSHSRICTWLSSSDTAFYDQLALLRAEQLYPADQRMAQLVLDGLVPLAQRPSATHFEQAWRALPLDPTAQLASLPLP